VFHAPIHFKHTPEINHQRRGEMGTYSALMDKIHEAAKKLDEEGKLDQMVKQAESQKDGKAASVLKDQSTKKRDK
jgi:hypothetical protein